MFNADQRCAVCRGDACTSTAQCTCPTTASVATDVAQCCVNCNTRCTTTLCKRCSHLPCCRRCKRRLPPSCFDVEDLNAGAQEIFCQACKRKKQRQQQQQPRKNFATTRRSTDNIVIQVNIPTQPSDSTFEAFFERTSAELQQYIDESQQMHRYVTQSLYQHCTHVLCQSVTTRSAIIRLGPIIKSLTSSSSSSSSSSSPLL